ncbi:response regulator [Paenibacillus sp. PAMC21692]|uniref:response regulator transcription factor n=1 Tax=Paenibacillus sp. PAMC21692 TaxID=2762320 RepID=UPI00164DFFA6|nr:response regulator [Paenibacillus sp. PAMC21692]QNK58874.1 response regulator [Paenibacillus sp. PAMC21692]
MRRILIVDDELFILNGLTSMVKEANFAELEVYKAASALEALDWLQRTTIDVVLTDICMPGMDGLELQRHIKRQWPRCKVIFLTGHDDFDYAREAIHQRAADYILKTDGDEPVLRAIRAALEELEAEFVKEEQFEQAKSRFMAALPYLQNEFLTDLLQGEKTAGRRLGEQFADLKLTFAYDRPVWLAIARVDEWADYREADKRLLLFAVQNIAQEYLAGALNAKSFVYEKNRMAWMIQADERNAEGERADLSQLLQGTFERIQQSCKQLLRLKLSFVMAYSSCEWPQIAARHDSLNRVMRRGGGLGHELLLTDMDSEGDFAETAPVEYSARQIGKLIDELGVLMESGQKDDFRQKLVELSNLSDGNVELKLMAAYRLISMLMTVLADEGLLKTTMVLTIMDRLLKLDANANWETTLSLATELGDAVFSRKESLNKQYGKSVIHRIRTYIEANLAGDLSQVRLGEVVALNPSYLSRLYKQIAGESLSDTIMSARLAAATEKLKKTDDKVQDIAVKVGFESAAYFNRFFKKAVGLTPQEYREQSRM